MVRLETYLNPWGLFNFDEMNICILLNLGLYSFFCTDWVTDCIVIILKTYISRVSTWCCDDILSQKDSLDILLYNDGHPIDILLLQSTQHSCPFIGNLYVNFQYFFFWKIFSSDGYEFVESPAPEYDPTAGVAVYWRQLVIIVVFDILVLLIICF